MKTIKLNLYSFSELKEDIKQKVLEEYRDINVDYEWWDYTLEDAKDIGLEIKEFDIYRNEINGELIDDIESVIKSIYKNHGKNCDTYKTAKDYKQMLKSLNELENDNYSYDYDELSDNFKIDLLQNYYKMLQKEEEYLISDEAIIETFEANEYTFEANGKMRNE